MSLYQDLIDADVPEADIEQKIGEGWTLADIAKEADVREPGYYWIKPEHDDDWEPATWNGALWLIHGVHAEDFDEPAWVGKRIEVPDDPTD